MISTKSRLRYVSFFVVFLFCFLMCATQTPAEKCRDKESVSSTLIYVSGHGEWIGSSQSPHLTPVWLLGDDEWVSFSFDKTTVLFMNGVPRLITKDVRIYMEGFRGVAPGDLWWVAKGSLGLRAHIFGVCSYYEIHE